MDETKELLWEDPQDPSRKFYLVWNKSYPELWHQIWVKSENLQKDLMREVKDEDVGQYELDADYTISVIAIEHMLSNLVRQGIDLRQEAFQKVITETIIQLDYSY